MSSSHTDPDHGPNVNDDADSCYHSCVIQAAEPQIDQEAAVGKQPDQDVKISQIISELDALIANCVVQEATEPPKAINTEQPQTDPEDAAAKQLDPDTQVAAQIVNDLDALAMQDQHVHGSPTNDCAEEQQPQELHQETNLTRNLSTKQSEIINTLDTMIFGATAAAGATAVGTGAAAADTTTSALSEDNCDEAGEADKQPVIDNDGILNPNESKEDAGKANHTQSSVPVTGKRAMIHDDEVSALTDVQVEMTTSEDRDFMNDELKDSFEGGKSNSFELDEESGKKKPFSSLLSSCGRERTGIAVIVAIVIIIFVSILIGALVKSSRSQNALRGSSSDDAEPTPPQAPGSLDILGPGLRASSPTLRPSKAPVSELSSTRTDASNPIEETLPSSSNEKENLAEPATKKPLVASTATPTLSPTAAFISKEKAKNQNNKNKKEKAAEAEDDNESAIDDESLTETPIEQGLDDTEGSSPTSITETGEAEDSEPKVADESSSENSIEKAQNNKNKNASSNPQPNEYGIMGQIDICALETERAVECGALNPNRPHSCCPGFECSGKEAGGTAFRCVPVAPVGDAASISVVPRSRSPKARPSTAQFPFLDKPAAPEATPTLGTSDGASTSANDSYSFHPSESDENTKAAEIEDGNESAVDDESLTETPIEESSSPSITESVEAENDDASSVAQKQNNKDKKKEKKDEKASETAEDNDTKVDDDTESAETEDDNESAAAVDNESSTESPIEESPEVAGSSPPSNTESAETEDDNESAVDDVSSTESPIEEGELSTETPIESPDKIIEQDSIEKLTEEEVSVTRTASPIVSPTQAPVAPVTPGPTGSPTESPTAAPTASTESPIEESPEVAGSSPPSNTESAETEDDNESAVDDVSSTESPIEEGELSTETPIESPDKIIEQDSIEKLTEEEVSVTRTASPIVFPTQAPVAPVTPGPTGSPTESPTAAPTASTESPIEESPEVAGSSPPSNTESAETEDDNESAVDDVSSTESPIEEGELSTETPIESPDKIIEQDSIEKLTEEEVSVTRTASPIVSPTQAPVAPVTPGPTGSPTESPTAAPTASPSTSALAATTAEPTTVEATSSPTASPTTGPTASPTELPVEYGYLETPLYADRLVDGIMFNIMAKDSDITITSIDLHLDAIATDVPVEVLWMETSYRGWELYPHFWRSDRKYVISEGKGIGQLTPIAPDDFAPIEIKAGKSKGIYILLSDGHKMFAGSVPVGNTEVTSNDSLEIEAGAEVPNRFESMTTGVSWSGAIQYTVAP